MRRFHEARGARVTIYLTRVVDPRQYGLVETEADGRLRAFREKPAAGERIATDTINAGIYVLETRVLDLMPAGVNYSIERGFFPALLARGDRVLGPVHRGYWLDIGRPEDYDRANLEFASLRSQFLPGG